MNGYSQYAEAHAPTFKKRSKPDKPPSALDLKMQEKQRLARGYRKWRADNARAVMTSEPRLAAFAAFLRKCSDRTELVEAIAESWLPAAAQPVRIHALRLIDARCNKMNQQAGFEPLDDPFPPETSAYFEAKKLLHTGGQR